MDARCIIALIIRVIIDPQSLLYETDASAYGGGKVEEGAFLLFHNHGGEYDFSRTSDFLKVINNGEQPAIVTVNAVLEGIDTANIIDSGDVEGIGTFALYLALIDDKGNETPVSTEGNASFSFELAPNSEYAFGLTGACNEIADLDGLSLYPHVNVTWSVETTADTEEEQKETVTEEAEQESSSFDETSSGNSVPDEQEIDFEALDYGETEDVITPSDDLSASEEEIISSTEAEPEGDFD